MKKKIFIVGLVLLLCYGLQTRAVDVYIPSEAIRFRVIPNSNSIDDQNIKQAVRDQIQPQLYELLKDETSIDQTRETIKNNLPSFEDTIKKTLGEHNSQETFNINFGKNYFPEKKYKGVIYPAGYYESLVVTLGQGQGDNWWCVLFPPLCLLEAEEVEAKQEVEYKSFVKEMIEKFFPKDTK